MSTECTNSNFTNPRKFTVITGQNATKKSLLDVWNSLCSTEIDHAIFCRVNCKKMWYPYKNYAFVKFTSLTRVSLIWPPRNVMILIFPAFYHWSSLMYLMKMWFYSYTFLSDNYSVLLTSFVDCACFNIFRNNFFNGGVHY